MSFDWNSGQKKSTGFDWDTGKSEDIVMPALPKPKVEMKEEYIPGLAKPYLWGVDAAAAADKALTEKPEDSTTAKVAKGVGRSAMKAGRALTEPKNLAIMGGLAAVNAAQLIPGSQPITVPLAQAANATAATYFGADMASQIPQQYGAYSEALKRGDTGGAAESLTDMGLTSAMAAGSARGGVELARPAVAQRMGVAKPGPVAPPPLSNTEARARGIKNLGDLTSQQSMFGDAPRYSPEAIAIAEKLKEGPLKIASAFKQYASDEILSRPGQTATMFEPPSRPEAFEQAFGMPASVEHAQSTIRPTRRRSAGQGGALAVPDFLRNKPTAGQPPIDPTVSQYIEQQKTLRAEAKKGAEGSFMDRLRSWRDAYRRTINDTTVPLTDAMQALDKQAGKTEVPASTRMNDLIDRKLGASKAASRWLRDEGILDSVGRVESLDALDQFMIAQRSAELEAAGFRSGRDLAADQSLIANLRDRIAIPAEKGAPAMTYGQVAKRFTDANNKLLRMAVDSGIVNKDVADSLVQKYGNYIPIERIQEAADFAHQHGRGASQVASLARQSILQKLTGSERVIDDSIVSSIHRADRVFSQVARNDAAGFLRDGLSKLDKGDGALIRPKKSGENVPPEKLISVFEGGVKKDYVVPEDIGVAAKSLDVKQLGWAMQNLVQPSTRLLKLGTTGLSLPFTVVNVFRDIGHTAVTQKGWAAIGGALDPRIYARGVKEVFDPKSKTMAALERHGGGFTSFDLSRGQVMPEIELMRAKRGSKEALSYVAHHPIRTVGALVRATENFLGKSEQFGRVRIYESEYRSAIKRGFSVKDAEILAAQEANNALPNYARAGSIGRVLNAMVPYLNARIQGVRSLTRAIERDPVGTIGKISAIGTAVAAVTAYNMMDDERREIYNDMQPYERRSNFIIILPGAKKNAKGRWEGVLKIPIPQGIDSITDVARKQVESMYGSDPVKFNDLAESLVGAFTPVEPSPVSNNIGVNVAAGAANSMLPQTVKPTVQSLANFNFFRGQAIVPPHMAELPAGEQSYPYTSSAAKTIARDVLPKVGLQTSPIKVEAWINDTLGGGGPMALRALDAAAEKTGLAEKQQEHGGADPFSATEQRMTTVRGGAIDRKYYDLRKQLQDTIAQREIDILRQSTDLDNMDRDTQRQLINQALGRAKSQVQKLINDSHLDEVEGSAKVDMMKDLLASYQ